MCAVVRVAENYVTVKLIGVYLVAYVNVSVTQYFLSYGYPVAFHPTATIDKPVTLIRGVNEIINYLAKIAHGKDRIGGIAGLYLIYNERVALPEIELLERLLPLLYSEAHFVGIVEKQKGTQHSTFTDALCSGKMHIAINHDFGVWYVCAINEYYFIEMSHK